MIRFVGSIAGNWSLDTYQVWLPGTLQRELLAPRAK